MYLRARLHWLPLRKDYIFASNCENFVYSHKKNIVNVLVTFKIIRIIVVVLFGKKIDVCEGNIVNFISIYRHD